MSLKTVQSDHKFVGNDKLPFGMLLAVLAFWLFAQMTLNIGPTMAADLGIEMSAVNIAIWITALFSGIFIVVVSAWRSLPLHQQMRLCHPCRKTSPHSISSTTKEAHHDQHSAI